MSKSTQRPIYEIHNESLIKCHRFIQFYRKIRTVYINTKTVQDLLTVLDVMLTENSFEINIGGTGYGYHLGYNLYLIDVRYNTWFKSKKNPYHQDKPAQWFDPRHLTELLENTPHIKYRYYKEFYDTNESKKAFQHAYLYLKYLAKKGITIHPYIELDLHHHFICQVCGHPIEQRDNVVLHHVTLDKYSKPDYNLYYFPKTQRHLLIPLHNACHPKGLESLAFFLKNRYYKRAEKVKLDIINAYFQSFKEFRVLLKRVTTRILEGL